jgi:hypothetical protein
VKEDGSKKKIIAILVAVVAVAVVVAVSMGSTEVNADDKCKPVNGHLDEEIAEECPSGAPAGALCTTGRYNGGIQGTYTFVLDLENDVVPSETGGVVLFSATSNIETKKGTLFFSEAGAFDTGTPPGNFVDLQTIIRRHGGF